MSKSTVDTGQWVEEIIREFLATSPDNSMNDHTGQPAWEEAIIGFASGADPIWDQYKEYVGPFHWTPWQIYSQNHPRLPARAEDLSVISWVLPQRRAVRRSNRKDPAYPSQEWARIRVYGEQCNAALRRHLVQTLTQAGHPAVAPMLVPNWTVVDSARFSYASSWSERHIAHACGLGTFGLCDGLITARGKAMRVGSVVAHIPIEPTPRPYTHHRAYCLHFARGACGKCITRCPAGAISEAGHDKEKCREHLVRTREYVQEAFHFEGYGCGLCQVGVPCEAGIPVKAAREALEKGELPPPPPPLA